MADASDAARSSQMCDRPHDKAVRSPWTEGAWIMRLGEVPAGWHMRAFVDEPFEETELSYEDWTLGMIVEAKP
jgi:hypothetical protein